MGADGGLNWIYLKDKKYCARVTELVKPLELIVTSLRKEDWEWLATNTEPQPTLRSRYGTDLDHRGMAELAEILIEDYEQDVTFAEAVEDLATRSEWQMYNFFSLEKAILRLCDHRLWSAYCGTGYYSWVGEFLDSEREDRRLYLQPDGLGSLQNIKIQDWLSELRDMIPKSCRTWSEETWT